MNDQVLFIRGGQIGDSRPWLMFHFDERRESDRTRRYDLVYFDMIAGTRKTWKNWIPQRKFPPPRPDSEVELKKVKMLRKRIDNSGFEVINRLLPSMVEVYDWVKAQPPNSIAAMHFFSHGDYSEPIIWEDCAEGGKPWERELTEPRHPNDTEPRRRDFYGDNPLSNNEGMKFWAAFAGDAFVKLWGCDSLIANRVLIKNQAKEPSPTRVLDILESVENTYAMLLAKLLGVVVWAPPIGWGSRPDPQLDHKELKYRGVWPPNWKTDAWWRIEAFDDDKQQVFRNFGARIDPTRYVGYHTSWVANARKQTIPPPLKVTTPKELQL